MPRIISDELYDAIVAYGPVYDNDHGPDDELDLYPVINGLLAQLRNEAIDVFEWTGEEAIFINESARLRSADGYVATIFESITGEADAKEQQTDSD